MAGDENDRNVNVGLRQARPESRGHSTRQPHIEHKAARDFGSLRCRNSAADANTSTCNPTDRKRLFNASLKDASSSTTTTSGCASGRSFVILLLS